MILKFEEFNRLFKEINTALTQKIHLYIIGGAVMLYHGLKPGTKDIDMIVSSRNEFTSTTIALKEISFKTKTPTKEYKRFDISQILEREDYRIDLFQKTVCRGFQLSNKMKERSEHIIKSNNLNVSLCSPTDIFMFKTFTEREGDLDDCTSLAKTGIDWGAMLQEIKYQIEISGHPVRITYIGERLDILQNKGLEIPIMKQIDSLRMKFLEDLEKRLQTKQ